MPDRPFRWGPLLAFTGLFGLGLYGWLKPPVSIDGTPVRPPPLSASAPLPPEPPPPSVRPVPPAPAMVPRFDRDNVRVEHNGSVTLSGTVDADARVGLIANGVVVADAPADGNGAWSVGPTPPLAPGTTEFRLRSTLPDGRTATSAGTLTVVMPRTTAEAFVVSLSGQGQAPVELARVDPVPVIAPSFGTTTVTPDGAITAQVRVDGGARVALHLGDRALAQATAGADGTASLGPVTVAEPGQHRLELRTTHTDGRTATSADRLVLDVPRLAGGAFSAVREAPGEAPVRLATREAVPAIAPRFGEVAVGAGGVTSASGVVDPGARVGLLAGDTVLRETDAGPDGRFALPPTEALPPGDHVLSLRSALADGRTASSPDRLHIAVPADARGTLTATLNAPGAAPAQIARIEPPPPPDVQSLMPVPQIDLPPPPTIDVVGAPPPAPAPVDVQALMPAPQIDLPPPPTIDVVGAPPAAPAPADVQALMPAPQIDLPPPPTITTIGAPPPSPPPPVEAQALTPVPQTGLPPSPTITPIAAPPPPVQAPAPAPPPAVAAPAPPVASPAPPVSRPTVRANVPPPQRRALPDHLIK